MQKGISFSVKLLNAVSDSILVHDFEGHLLYANTIAYKSRGYPKAEFMKINVRDLVAPEYASPVETQGKEILLNGESTFESVHLRKDKSVIPVEIHSRVMTLDGQKCIVAVVRDITERKRMMEIERDFRLKKQAQDELLRLQIQQQTILNNIPDMAWIKDVSSKYIAVNEAMASTSGVQVSDFIGQTDQNIYLEEIANNYIANDQQVMASGQRQVFEEPFVGINKELIWVETVKTPLFNQNGQVIGTIGIARDITKRRKMEDQLRESERRFRELADLLPVIAFESDLKGKLIYVNNLAFKLFGYTREEFLGKPIFDYIAPEDRERSISNARRVMTGEYLGNNEYTAIRKDGSRLSALIQTAPLRNEQGTLIGTRGVLVDISKQKAIEVELRASEEKFRALFEQIQEGIILANSSGEVIGWNAVQEQLSGVSREEILGHYLWDLPQGVSVKEPDQVEGRLKIDHEILELLHTRQSPILNQPCEIEIKSRDGKTHLCLSVVILIEIGEDFMLGLISKDITERKKIEQALQESEAKYRNLIQNIKLGIFRTVPETGHILEVNTAMEELTGYTRDELLHLNAEKLYQSSEEREEFLRQLILNPEKATLTSRLRKKDGTFITATMIAKAVQDKNGRIIYIDGSLEDITERKLLEERIIDLYENEKKQRQELQEEANARGMFIDVLAHELRTPLTSILVSIGILYEQLKNGDDIYKRLAANIRSGVETLTKRLEELLELARYSRGTFKLNKQTVDIQTHLTEVIARFKPYIDQQKQILAVDIAGELPTMEIDRSRFEQIILNLLSNASKFSPPETQINFRARLQDDALLLEVQDEGIGISPEESERIFQPYHRVEQDRLKFPGLGLGLAVARQIIEAHGGKIWVTSEVDKGSTFSCLIPIKTEKA